MPAKRKTRRRSYRVEVKPSVERDLAGLEKRDRLRVARKIDALAEYPRPAGVEKLSGEDDLWRVRAGDYRIIYAIRDDVLLVLVVRVGHRRDVYRKK
jgi:mRNA interferase RelE/StbE